MIGTDLLNFSWNLKDLSDFVEEAKAYKKDFEEPLDQASGLLRNELARILGSKSTKHSHIGKQPNDPVAQRPNQDVRLRSRPH
jgi:hypothetical protein